MNLDDTKEQIDLTRIEKEITSPLMQIRLPKPQIGAEMWASAIGVFSRIAMLREVYRTRFTSIYDRVQIPICFMRRNPLVDDLDRLDPLSNKPKLFAFRDEKLQSPVPSVTFTRTATDQCPADLRAMTYEVRYLTLEELAILALRSTARERLTEKQLEKVCSSEKYDIDGELPYCDGRLYSLAADLPVVDKTGWQEAARRRFDIEMRLNGLADEPLQRDFDERETIINAIDAMHKKGGKDEFPKHQSNYYFTKVWSKRTSDPLDSSQYNWRKRNMRLYDADVEFEFSYLHTQTMAKESKPHGCRAVKVPAELFAKEYDEPGSVDLMTSDPVEVDTILRTRLAAALVRFGQKIESKEDMLRFFGGTKHLDRFNSLMEWRSKAFLTLSNQRAVSAALLDAVQRFLDIMEKAMTDEQFRKSTFSLAMTDWDSSPDAQRHRLHPQLLQFTKTGEVDYNDWYCDMDNYGDERYAYKMIVPVNMSLLFYGNCFSSALRDATKGPLCDVLPVNQTKEASLIENSFAECWRTVLAKTNPSLLQSDLRLMHDWPHRDVSAYRFPDGYEFCGFILTLEQEPINSINTSSINWYGGLHSHARRKLHLNPFYKFYEIMEEYIVCSTEVRQEYRKSWPEVTCFADETVSEICLRDHTAALFRIVIENRDADPALKVMAFQRWEYAKSHPTLRNVTDSLLMGDPISRTKYNESCTFVMGCSHRAAGFDQSLTDIEARPFSTLYDFGAHCYKSVEISKRRRAAVHEKQASTETQVSAVKQGSIANPVSRKKVISRKKKAIAAPAIEKQEEPEMADGEMETLLQDIRKNLQLERESGIISPTTIAFPLLMTRRIQKKELHTAPVHRSEYAQRLLLEEQARQAALIAKNAIRSAVHK